MKTRLEQVLERCLGGREVALWGNPTRAVLRALRLYGFHIAEKVDRARHYVVAVTDDDIEDFLADEQSGAFAHVSDYLVFEDEGGELPFERECHGVRVGRETYFGDGIVGACKNGYIESIGHFTSISGSADMGVNHQLGMVFTSDDIAELFTEENKALFERETRSDRRHPYAYGKERMTIGSDVYIGANAFINASKVTKIGDGAVIGAGAVVLEDVPPYAVAVGVPARVKRYRFPPDMVETLLRVKWWDWSAEEINENAGTLMSLEAFGRKFAKC